jgi:hypothetical protein
MSADQFPAEPEAERAVLGACMLSALAIEQVQEIIEPSDFFLADHQLIFAAMKEAHGHGEVVEPISLQGYLPPGRTVDAEYLHGLLNGTYTTSNVARYAESVAAANVRRRLIHASSEISRMAFDGSSATAGDLIDKGRDLLASIDMPVGRGPEDPDVQDFIDQMITPYDWLVPDFLERTDRCLVTGGEGKGKSFLLQQIAVMVASGIHPLALTDIPPVKVTFIDLENSARLVARRFNRLRELAGPKLPRRMVHVHSRPFGIDITKRPDRLWLADRCAANGAELLVIGPAYRLYGGTADRGDVGQEDHIRTVTAALDDLRVRCGITLLMETHAPHGDRSGRDLRPFGSSVWLRWPEFGVGLKESEERNYYELKHWRGARDERTWPRGFMRGTGKWPWMPVISGGPREY